jgi:hypothetical protein
MIGDRSNTLVLLLVLMTIFINECDEFNNAIEVSMHFETLQSLILLISVTMPMT